MDFSTDQTEKKVQDWWVAFITKLKADGDFKSKPQITGIDTHLTPVLGRRKPDITFYERNNPSVLFGVTGLVELTEYHKKPAGTHFEFSDSKCGQLGTFLARLINLQPFRQSATGFVSDGCRIRFMRVDRDTIDKQITVGPTLPFENNNPMANRWLWSFLLAKPEALGWSVPNIAVNRVPIRLMESLGAGANSNVYRGEYFTGSGTVDTRMVVVKVFKPDALKRGNLEREIRNLRHVSTINDSKRNAIVARVTEYVATADSDDVKSKPRALVVSPVGLMFAIHPNDYAATGMFRAMNE